jgi:ADP-ribosylglycohydrolase
MVELPAGTYSDDTQLRLAVGRSIRADGRFDLEAFSKIELPVFLSYEMRAGKSTKAAAYELMKRHVRWSSNFFDSERARYINAGGNGAAMRIQPHVWSAPGYSPKQFLGRVAADAVVTHGHPRAVVGAVIHANALSSVLRHGSIPDPEVWAQIVDYANATPDVMLGSDVLRERWLPTWERATSISWSEGVREAVKEGQEMIHAARKAASAPSPDDAYHDLLVSLGGKRRESVGSGMIAAVASLFAAWVFRDDPAHGLRVIANQLGTDTDTIGTMTGALVGPTVLAGPPGPILDQQYIASEANRMIAVGEGQPTRSFPHPDPIKWKPPRSLSDAVGTVNGELAVAGLGPVVDADGEYPVDSKDLAVYQWMTLAHGQTVLIKRRRDLAPLPDGALQVERPIRAAANGSPANQAALFNDQVASPPSRRLIGSVGGDLGEALERVIAADFDPEVIGDEMLRFAVVPEQGLERSSEFAVAVAATYRTRRSQRSRS